MKVLHVNSYYCTNDIHRQFVVALKSEGVDQKTIVPISGAQVLQHGKALSSHIGVTAVEVRGGDWKYGWPVRIASAWSKLKAEWATDHPTDLVHSHTLITNGILAYLAHRKWGVPYVVTVRNSDVHTFVARNRVFGELAKRILLKAAGVVFLSPGYVGHLEECLGANPSVRAKIAGAEILPNGLEMDWIHDRPSTARKAKGAREPLSVLFVGRVNRNKNVRGVLQACRVLIDDGEAVRLNIVGDGPLIDVLKKDFSHSWIRWHGRVNDRRRLKSLYRRADVVAVPSFTESFGMVYLEALSQGAAIIYSKGEGFDGYVRDGAVGFAVDPQSPTAIATALRATRRCVVSLSEAALGVAPDFGWDEVAGKWAEFYRSILQG